MRLKDILSRSGAATLGRIVTTACVLVANGIAYRAMSQAEFGFWAMLLNLMALTLSFDLGFRFSMSNRLAALSARREQGETERRETFLASFYVVLTIAVVCGAVFPILSRWVHWENFFNLGDPRLAARAKPLIPLTGLLLLAVLPWSLCGGISNAYDEIEIGVFLASLLAVVVTIVFAAASRTHSFEVMILSYFATSALGNFLLTLFFLVRRRWNLLPPPWPVFRRVVASLLPRSMEFFGFSLCSTLALIVGTIISGYTSGAAAAGEYSVITRIFSFLTTLHLAFLGPVGPLVTRHAYADDWNDVRDRLRTCLVRIWPVVFPLTGGLLLAAHPVLLRLWLGRWITDYWLAGLLMAAACALGLLNTYSVFLNSLGLIRVQATLAYIMLLPTMLLPVWLGKWMGPHGVALAALVCMLPGLVVLPIYTRSALRHKLIRV